MFLSLNISLSLITFYSYAVTDRLHSSFPSLGNYRWTYDTCFDIAFLKNLQCITDLLITECLLLSLLCLSTYLVKQPAGFQMLVCITVSWRASSFKNRLLGPARVSGSAIGLGPGLRTGMFSPQFPCPAGGGSEFLLSEPQDSSQSFPPSSVMSN